MLKKKIHSRTGYLVRSIEHPAKSHLCTGGASENTQCAFKLHIVIEKGEKEEREKERKRDKKKATRFWRSGITRWEGPRKGMNKVEGGRKTGGSAPTEFFGGITDLYFTPDLPSDVYVFNILDAQTARACAHRCTDASRSTNVQRCTIMLPSASLYPPVGFPRRAFSRSPLASSHFYTNP